MPRAPCPARASSRRVVVTSRREHRRRRCGVTVHDHRFVLFFQRRIVAGLTPVPSRDKDNAMAEIVLNGITKSSPRLEAVKDINLDIAEASS